MNHAHVVAVKSLKTVTVKMLKFVSMSRYIIAITLIMAFAVKAQAQQDSTGVKVISSGLLDLKLKHRTEAKEEAEGMEGFRIQVYFGDDRKEAEKVKTDLEELFPDFKCYTIIELPYYKVRIGNFRSRVAAQALFFALQHIYPNVFIVSDKIDWPSIQEPPAPNPKDFKKE